MDLNVFENEDIDIWKKKAAEREARRKERRQNATELVMESHQWFGEDAATVAAKKEADKAAGKEGDWYIDKGKNDHVKPVKLAIPTSRDYYKPQTPPFLLRTSSVLATKKMQTGSLKKTPPSNTPWEFNKTTTSAKTLTGFAPKHIQSDPTAPGITQESRVHSIASTNNTTSYCAKNTEAERRNLELFRSRVYRYWPSPKDLKSEIPKGELQTQKSAKEISSHRERQLQHDNHTARRSGDTDPTTEEGKVNEVPKRATKCANTPVDVDDIDEILNSFEIEELGKGNNPQIKANLDSSEIEIPPNCDILRINHSRASTNSFESFLSGTTTSSMSLPSTPESGFCLQSGMFPCKDLPERDRRIKIPSNGTDPISVSPSATSSSKCEKEEHKSKADIFSKGFKRVCGQVQRSVARFRHGISHLCCVASGVDP